MNQPSAGGVNGFPASTLVSIWSADTTLTVLQAVELIESVRSMSSGTPRITAGDVRIDFTIGFFMLFGWVVARCCAAPHGPDHGRVQRADDA